ncbi:phage tail protein [Fodinicurvata sp. EGI_FJ10296]|uniref:phage tail protein n=1 Tax=Fodinicurvata sp. EGI_FJ10296 TaxID=3231908 RepID=UPI0034527C9B
MSRPDFDISVAAQLDSAHAVLDPYRAKRAISRAVTATARTVRTHVSRDVAKFTGLKVGGVRRAMELKNASPDDPVSTVTGTGRPLPLHQAAKRVRQTETGVRGKAYGQSKKFDRAFVAMMTNGHVGIFTRARVVGGGGKKVGRLKIRELYGPSIPSAMVEDHVEETFAAVVADRLPRALSREIDRELYMADRAAQKQGLAAAHARAAARNRRP